MIKKISFLKSTVLYFVGVFGSKVVLFILLPLYSFYLSKEELGEFDLILVSVTLFTPLVTIQLADSVYRHLLDTTNISTQKIIISTALKVILIGLVIFTILLKLLNFFFEYNGYLAFILVLFSSCFYVFFQQVIRGLGHNKWYAIMGLVNTILTISLSAIFVIVLDKSVAGILIAFFISQMASVFLILYFKKLYKFTSLNRFDKQIAKKLIKYSWPLLPNSISWWLIDLGNRYIILFFLNEEYNGIYAISARYAGIITLFNSIFLLTWQDYAISDIDSNTNNSVENASKMFNKFMVFELTAIIVLSSMASYIVEFTTDAQFHEASNYLPILLLSAGASSFCAFYGALYLKAKDTFKVFTSTIIGGIVNVVFSVLFINNLGLYSVAIGSLIGFSTTLIIRSNHYKLNINYKIFTFCLLFYCLVLLFRYFVNLDNFYSVLVVILCVILFLVLNRKQLILLKGKILS